VYINVQIRRYIEQIRILRALAARIESQIDRLVHHIGGVGVVEIDRVAAILSRLLSL